MAVRIRLTRMGRRNRPFYRVVIADSRSRRDGGFIEQIGSYDPIKRDNNFSINEDRVFHWLRVGAQPTDTIKRLLSHEGIMLKWHLENSDLSDEKKKQELQKWELAKAERAKGKPGKKAVPEEKKEEKAEEPVAEVKEEKEAEEVAEAPAKAEVAVEAEKIEETVAEPAE